MYVYIQYYNFFAHPIGLPTNKVETFLLYPWNLHLVVFVLTSPQTWFVREVLFYSCESVCLLVCLSVIKITQKVLDRFQ